MRGSNAARNTVSEASPRCVCTRRGVTKKRLLYLGEINDSRQAQGCPALDVQGEAHFFASFPSYRLQTTLKSRTIL